MLLKMVVGWASPRAVTDLARKVRTLCRVSRALVAFFWEKHDTARLDPA